MRLWQIQSKAQPVTPPGSEKERTTPDKWQPQANTPQSNFNRVATYSLAAITPALFFVNLVQPTGTTPNSWQPETNRPVYDIKRQQYTYPVTAPQDPTSMRPNQIWVDKLQTTNQYLHFPDVKRNQFLYPPTALSPYPITAAEVITVDKWFSPAINAVRKADSRTYITIGDPVLTAAQGVTNTITSQDVSIQFSKTTFYQRQAFVPVVAITETITLDKWFTRTQVPVFTIRNINWATVSNLVLTATQRPEAVSLDRWQQPTSQPRFDVNRRQWIYPPFTVDVKQLTQKERTTVDKWQPETNKPLFDVKRQQYSFPSTFFHPEPQEVTQFESPSEFARNVDKVYDIRRNQYLYPSFTVDAYQLAQKERVSFDKWNYQQSLPRWDIQRRQWIYPSLFYDEQAFTQPETPNYGKWNLPQSQPLFDVKRAQHTYQFIAYDHNGRTERSTPDKWLPLPNQPLFDIKRQQFVYPAVSRHPEPIVALETISPDKWHPLVAQPLFDRKRVQWLYQVWTVDPKHLTQKERLTLDKWFRETQQPRFDIRRWQFVYPDLFRFPECVPNPWTQVSRATNAAYNEVSRSSDASYSQVSRSSDANYNQVSRPSDANYTQVTRDSNNDWNRLSREC